LTFNAFDDFTEFAAEQEFTPMRELIYLYVRSAILNGDLQTGMHLVEEELAKRLNVSRTPVREALRKLEADGLVKHYRRRGVEVRQITPKDATELYEICALLEGYAANLMVQHANTEEIKKLRIILNEMQNSMEMGDKDREMKSHREFHSTIYATGGNKRLEQLLCGYNEYLELSRNDYIKDYWTQTYKEHEQLCQAIESRDALLAEAVARNHILQSDKIRENIYPLPQSTHVLSGSHHTRQQARL